ncbi:hypothetical protein PLESTB_000114800 [Pleodorina starrii]|uniref:Calcineurin-like phosphoesterase domain-containing protein n=1 Tax=Pleodorina starrii TaxID=330485 RepID=A0A9W6BBG4_9CHLO|nr:hypothetical protein PLESTM_000110400 [Pleodorina starrii]GLC48592.1 hypothetical protein PLESTB_000114800 [Pleodorina starrii]GLC71913.1 hypothetical protein PLESTF_001180500 [Pleodorina starrii]
MQALRGAVLGRPVHQAAPQQQPSRGHRMEASAPTPKPHPAACGVFGWALSALGLRRPQVATPAAAASPTPPAAAGTPGRLRLAIVGDVHGAWRGDREEAALRLLAPDLTLLVGDFGNEDVRLVRQVAELGLPKAVILGNHDAWFTMTGRSGAARRGGVQQTLSAADLLADMRARGGGGGGGGDGGDGATSVAGGPAQDGVRQQLAALGTCHVGYGTMQLDEQGYTVMGARPFSKGGKNFSTIRAFMEGLYGVTSMEESAARIVQVAESAPPHHALVVMGHNGPAGLGSRAFDICGVDWESKAGDHGDPDLQAALSALHRSGRPVALVTFGHMHHTLHSAQNRGRTSRFRRMVALDPTTGTVFLNAATVPRVVLAPTAAAAAAAAAAAPPPTHGSGSAAAPPSTSPKSYGSGRRARMAAKAAAAAAAASSAVAAAALPTGGGPAYGGGPATQHHFMVAELERGEVVSARDVWVQVTPVTDGTAAAVLEAASAAATAAAVPASRSGIDGDGGGANNEAVDSDTDGDEGIKGEEDEVAAASAALGPRRIGDFVVQVVRDHVVLRTVAGANGGVVKFVWNAYDQVYEPYVLDGGGAAVRQARGGEGSRADDGDDDGGGGGAAAADEAVGPAVDGGGRGAAELEAAAVTSGRVR